MNYYWHVITTPTQWETLTKQTSTYPESFPVLAGCVALSDTEFVVCPLPVAEIPKLLAGVKSPVCHEDSDLVAGEETNRED